MRHVIHERYDIVQMACMMLPYMGISQPDRLYNEVLVHAHPSEKARKNGPALHSESASERATSGGSSLWMDQSSPVVDPVLLSSVDVTRPVLRRLELGMSLSGATCLKTRSEIRDPMTGKSRRLSLSLQKRPREHDSDSVKVKKPWKALQASRLATMI